MKHLYAFLLAMLAFIVPANVYGFVIKVDNPEAVTIYQGTSDWVNAADLPTSGLPVVDLTAGDYNFPEFNYAFVVANDGYLITELTYPWGSSNKLPYNGTFTTVRGYNPTEEYTITTMSTADFYNASCTVKCDDFSVLEGRLNDDYNAKCSFPTEGEGEYTLPFNTEFFQNLTLANTTYKPFYAVTVNGTAIENPGSSCNIPLVDGNVIEVTTKYPEVSCTVKITLVNEGTESCITRVTVDDEEITPEVYLSENFSVNCGQSLSIQFDNQAYNVKSVEYNGESVDSWGLTQYIINDSEIKIDAEKYPTIQKTIEVEGAEFMTFSKGWGWNDNSDIAMTDGINIFEYIDNEEERRVSVKPNFGCYIVELKDGDRNLMEEGWSKNNSSFLLSPEGTLTIKAAKIVKDKTMVVYVDALQQDEEHNYGFSFFNGEYYYYTNDPSFHAGYNIIEFYDGDGLFGTSWGNAYAKDNFYINGVKQESWYGYYYNELTINDGDVLKFYLSADPVNCELSFDNQCEKQVPVVKRDMIVPVDDLASSYTVFGGTHVSVDAPEGQTINVQVGDQPESDAAHHEFFVNGDTKVTIKDGITDSVGNVAVDAVESTDVYNLQGVKVADKADMSRLPKGIYIIGGRKVAL